MKRDAGRAKKWLELCGQQTGTGRTEEEALLKFDNQGETSSQTISELKGLAEQGDPAAQTTLGRRLLWGDGALPDKKQALTWFSKAADTGYTEAFRELGEMHEYGQGKAADFEEAFRLYSLAAEKGDAYSQAKIGYLYQDRKRRGPRLR